MAITISTPTLYTLTGNKNKILVTTDTSGVTAHFLHLKIDVFKSDGVTIIDSFTDKLPVINGKATFEIQEFLRQKQTGNFTELIVNHQEHDLVVSYTLSAFETYDYSNTEQNTIIDPTLYYAIQGKIGSEYELRLETLASTFYADWLQANKFLTNKPRTLNQLTNERLKLYYLALATESVDLICDIVFADASTSSITIETISMTQNKIYELLVGFTELKLAAKETTSKIASYKIYLQTTAWTSEVFEITIERDYYPNQHQFIFKNAFGVYDTILFRGIQENNKSYENVFGSINNKQLAVSKIATNSFSTASGILPYSIKSWIWEFSNSLDAYSIVGDIIYSIIIKNESDVSIVDNSFLYGHIVKYEQVDAVKQIVENVPKIVIDILIDDYITQTTGVTLYFTGSVKGKYDDGAEFDFVSETENLRTYAANGSYRLVIYGDLANIIGIKAGNSNIINIDFVKLNQLVNISLENNLFTTLDLTNVPISGFFHVPTNANLTSITFARSGNGLVNHFNIDNCDITGNLDLTNVPISGLFQGRTNANLTSITFASYGNGLITNFRTDNCDITGNLDLTNVPISGFFHVLSNANLTSVTFASYGNGLVNYFNIGNCDITGNLDLTNVPISGFFNIASNANLTSVTFASYGNGLVNYFYFIGTDITGNLDLTNVPVSVLFQGNSNANLTSITFASSGNGVTAINLPFCSNLISLDLTNVPISKIDTRDCVSLNSITLKSSGNGQVGIFKVNNCDLPDIDITVLNTSNNISAEHQDNNFIISESDAQIGYYVSTGWTGGTLNMAGTNAAPSTAGEANIDILRSRGWTVTVTGGY